MHRSFDADTTAVYVLTKSTQKKRDCKCSLQMMRKKNKIFRAKNENAIKRERERWTVVKCYFFLCPILRFTVPFLITIIIFLLLLPGAIFLFRFTFSLFHPFRLIISINFIDTISNRTHRQILQRHSCSCNFSHHKWLTTASMFPYFNNLSRSLCCLQVVSDKERYRKSSANWCGRNKWTSKQKKIGWNAYLIQQHHFVKWFTCLWDVSMQSNWWNQCAKDKKRVLLSTMRQHTQYGKTKSIHWKGIHILFKYTFPCRRDILRDSIKIEYDLTKVSDESKWEMVGSQHCTRIENEINMND